MKKSLDYKKRFILLIIGFIGAFTLIMRKFVFPSIEVCTSYYEGNKKLLNIENGPLTLRVLQNEYALAKSQMGISNQSTEELQLDILSTLETCTPQLKVKVTQVTTDEPVVSNGYQIYFNKIILQGAYEDLLTAIDCLEKELNYGVISSLNFDIDNKNKNLYVQLTVQNIVRT